MLGEGAGQDIIAEFLLPARRHVQRGGERAPTADALPMAAQLDSNRAPDAVRNLGFELDNGKRFAAIFKDASGERHEYFFTQQDAETARSGALSDRISEVLALGKDGAAQPDGAARYARDEEGRARFLTQYQKAAFRSALQVRQAQAQGKIKPDPARLNLCFPNAAVTAAVGDFDMVIGRASMAGGGRGWHAVVRMPDGGIFDPVERQFYAPGVYETAGRFAPVRVLKGSVARSWLNAKDGLAPDPQTLGMEEVDFSLADARPKVQQRLNDLFETRKTFNVWHKTVGTQCHKAQVDSSFIPSRDPAERAPSVVRLVCLYGRRLRR